MQKYQSIISGTNGSVIRNVPVTVLKEDGSLAEIFMDREGQVQAPNPLVTDSRGVFYFYAKNGRYSLRTAADGVQITDADTVLLFDPDETASDGPIADAVRRAEDAAERAETALGDSGLQNMVQDAQDAAANAAQAVIDANQAVASIDGALIEAGEAKDAAQAAAQTASNAASGAQAVKDSLLDNQKRTPLHFATLAEAQAAAATLPDGQSVVALDTNAMYRVSGGTLDFEKSVAQLASPLDYQAKGDGETNDDAAFSALESAVVGEVVDLLGREYLVSVVPSGNDYINGSFSIGRSKEDRRVVPSNSLVQPMRAYKRKPIPFPAVNQYTNTILADGGQYYPNSMCIDEVDDEVYFTTNPPCWVSVYDFHTRQIKTTFKLEEGASSGTVIYRKEGRKFLVARCITGVNNTKAAFYDITTPPTPLSTVYADHFSTFSIGHSHTIRGDYLYTTMRGSIKGNGVNQRNIIEVFDLRTDALSGRLILDPAKTGFANESITTFPKMQGFDVMGGYLLVANGNGGYNQTTDQTVNPSRMQGYRVLASDGSTVAEAFFDPKSMGDKMISLGYRYQYNECEGIHFAYGRIYTMYALAGMYGEGKEEQGFMLFEEMSEAPDAIDFSDCAAFVPSNLTRFYNSTYPRASYLDGTTQTFTSMYDGSEITSVAGLFEMMYQLQMDSLTISTRGTALANGLGANLAASGMLRLYNQDNEYFLAELINYTGNSAGYNVYAVRTGENAYTFSRNNPDYWDGSLVPREVGTQDLGAGVRVWNNVFGNRFGPTSARMIQWGSGNPNGVVAASYGSVFFNTGGGAGETMWVKETGGATNTGWVAK